MIQHHCLVVVVGSSFLGSGPEVDKVLYHSDGICQDIFKTLITSWNQILTAKIQVQASQTLILTS